MPSNRTRRPQRAAWRYGALAALLAAVSGVCIVIVSAMPGRSFVGNLPEFGPAQVALRDRLAGHVNMLAGNIGERNLYRYPALEAAAVYIEDTLHSAGYEPAVQGFDVEGFAVRNIEVEIRGGGLAAETVVVGAHYDSVRGSPGANDNATGVAAVLEIARALRDAAPRRTVRLVAYVNEEPPFYYTPAMGSRRHAERAAAAGERIIAMLSLETIGYYEDTPGSQRYPFPLSLFYPDTGNFIGLRRQPSFSRTSAPRDREFSPPRAVPLRGCRRAGVVDRNRLVGSFVVLESRLSGNHGHRHRIVPLPRVPHLGRPAASRG